MAEREGLVDSDANGASGHPSGRARLSQLTQALESARDRICSVVLGQEAVAEQMLIGLATNGHVLLEGPPGVGKTLLVRTLAKVAGLSFARVQFTPDLMPGDITGTMILATGSDGRTHMEFQQGPVFTQLLLADEINRATPRTQSALLEAMQERTVSAAGRSFPLPEPFFVLATQNPFEMEGTYILPEAQIDRFMLRIEVPYPNDEVLADILQQPGTGTGVDVEQVLTPKDILELQDFVRAVPTAEHVRKAVAHFASSTQPGSRHAAEETNRYMRFGLSPRGAQALMMTARAHALFKGRYNVSFDDLKAMLLPATRHRMQLNFEARADGVVMETMVQELFERSVRQFR